MPRKFELELTDDQLASLEQYIERPENKDHVWSEQYKLNLPMKRWDTVEDWIQHVFTSALKGPIATCPPAAAQAKLDQIAALQREVDGAAAPALRRRDA